jgi:hypothetical protein
MYRLREREREREKERERERERKRELGRLAGGRAGRLSGKAFTLEPEREGYRRAASQREMVLPLLLFLSGREEVKD